MRGDLASGAQPARLPLLQERVIGTLLGEENDGVVEIKNCFPVPHTEVAEEVRADFSPPPSARAAADPEP